MTVNLFQPEKTFIRRTGTRYRAGLVMLVATTILAGCTFAPKGENRMRQQAATAGKPFEKPYAQRHLPPLPASATPAELVRYAVLNNPDVEKAYWKWRAAIEQIPQAGTQLTTLMLSAGTTLQNGRASTANTILGAGNMTSADIRWPSKLSADAKAALQAARAAGWQYRSEIFAVRRSVLAAWYRYAQTSVVLRLTMSQRAILHSLAALSKAGISTGGRDPGQWLAARNSINQLQTEIIELRNRLPRDLATLNALLGRPAAATLNPPDTIPNIAPPKMGNHALLMLALRRNPDIRGLRRFISADRISIRRAKLQYIPNFDLGVSSSLDGTAQSISSALVVPVFRYKAINASIAQARDRLRGAQAALRGKKVDLDARLLIDVIALRNDHAQLALFAGKLLPRVKMINSLAQTDYQQGIGGIQEQVRAQRKLLEIRAIVAELQADQDIRIADIDAIIAAPL